MTYITDNKALFFVTSPRTPDKMIDEIRLLVENFSGKTWNPETQAQYYLLLCKQDFFNGSTGGDIALKARDRISRAPKALGFVNLKPTISITKAGHEYVYGKRSAYAFTKQLIKFQLQSPFHIDKNDLISVRPYLEFMRLIHDLGGLTKAEIAIFGLQLTHHDKYDEVKSLITNFRKESKLRTKNTTYNSFKNSVFERELRKMFADEIAADETSTRQSTDTSVENFITTKRSNHNDYADAATRYLRATGLFTLDPFQGKLTVAEGKEEDVDYIYSNIDTAPYSYKDEDDYKEYLFDSRNIELLTDNRELLIHKIKSINERAVTGSEEVSELQDIYDVVLAKKLETKLKNEIDRLQKYENYHEVDEVFSQVVVRGVIDAPLILEWNTWRAFNMLGDGYIQGNFKVDDEGAPLSTAVGNMADIECHYDDFKMIVEVTMSSGQKQYEMEGEPVARHLGNLKKTTDQDVYCIFIAPTLSDATLAHFYALHKITIIHYGGKAKIIPLQLDVFKTMLKNANEAKNKPNAQSIREFLDKVTVFAEEASDEQAWIAKINNEALKTFMS